MEDYGNIIDTITRVFFQFWYLKNWWKFPKFSKKIVKLEKKNPNLFIYLLKTKFFWRELRIAIKKVILKNQKIKKLVISS